MSTIIPMISAVQGTGEDAHRLVRVDDRDLTLRLGFPDGVERVSGAELSAWLGHSRERDFFERVVFRLEKERPDFGVLSMRAELRAWKVAANLERTQTVQIPWLTERQALLAAVESDTDNARRVYPRISDLFGAARKASEAPVSAAVGDAARPSTVMALYFEEKPVHLREERVSLTDMWRAAGADESKRPVEWLRSKQATEFREFLEENPVLGISQDGIVRMERGGRERGGTWAHRVGLQSRCRNRRRTSERACVPL